MTRTETLELGQLADYEIVGELAGPDDGHRLLANRRSDERAVLITVVREPSGDQGNALSHLAADTNLLAAERHTHVVPVLEGRWVGTDAFATVTERPTWPTLQELLTRREEELSYARIAAVLRDVNAALEWARERKVVHRALRPDTVFVEPGSDDVQVSFTIAPLPATGMPGAEADARTIASLARAMLTRSAMDPERDRVPLSELRPGLPATVIAQTEALRSAEGDRVPDASGYIAAIAMADDLKRAEVEREDIRRQIDEEQRRIRTELTAEREAHDRDLADQAKRFAQERERERDAMAKEQERAKQELARERDKAQKEIAKARAALDKERQRLARERAKFEQEVARSREQIATRLAAIGEQETLYAATSELPVAVAETPLVEHASDAPEDASESPEHAVASPEPALALPEPASPTPEEPYDEVVEDDWWKERDSLTPTPPTFRTAGIALLVLVLLVAASAVALSRRGHRHFASTSASAVQVDSTGGNVVAPVANADTTPLGAVISSPPPQPAPTLSSNPSPSEASIPRPHVVSPARQAELRDSVARSRVRDSTPEAQTTQRGTSPVVTPPQSDTVKPLPFTGTDSARRDSTQRTVRDSVSKLLPKIVLPKPDSIAPRRDTTSGP